ncbi:MAG: formylglycine-generating enzyme family protein [Planctomycetes bacterium]|nr:formylglycine-generating enzyme family protein [Planctomycetota bacterium]
MNALRFTRLAAALVVALSVTAAHAITIDWVTVGDPGNAADTTGDPNPAGAVAASFQIMKYEFTNQQYTDFLNSVAATDPYSLYNASMGTDARGGITQSGSAGSFTYAVKPNMGDKPVNFVSWFDAARVSNWLMNGATSTSSTETGAYTLVGGQTSGNAPAVNSGATFFIPTEDQWYKAAYYKGGSTNAGYWTYATQSDTTPSAVTSGSTGIGTAGSTGNFANYANGAMWNGQFGNVTTVGTNGSPSAYGAFDMSGNIEEWNDLTGVAGSTRGLRGGSWPYIPSGLSASTRNAFNPSFEFSVYGFRLAGSVSSPSGVPEIDPAGLGSVLAIVTGALGLLERRRSRR